MVNALLIRSLLLLATTSRHAAASLNPLLRGIRTNPNCPPDDASSCRCIDGVTPCSYDQECPSTKAYELKADCPKGKTIADCNQRSFVAVDKPPTEGSCRSSSADDACLDIQENSGLIVGDVNQCDAGSLCGDFTTVKPAKCIPCLKPMSCHDWCNLDDNLGSWNIRGSLESFGASTTCPGGGYDSCTCTLYSMMANTHSVARDTHAGGAICGAHHFGPCGEEENWCTAEFPNDTYCASLGSIYISGTLNAESGVCTCHATVGSSWTKDVWSSECVENLYNWGLGPGGEKSMGLPCSFTG